MSYTPKKCAFCGAVEGKPRPLGRFIVELKPVEGEKDTYACQSCMVHRGSSSFPKMKKSIFERIAAFFSK